MPAAGGTAPGPSPKTRVRRLSFGETRRPGGWQPGSGPDAGRGFPGQARLTGDPVEKDSPA